MRYKSLLAALLFTMVLAQCTHSASDIQSRVSRHAVFLYRGGDRLAAGGGLLVSGGRVVTCMHVMRSITSETRPERGTEIKAVTPAGPRILKLAALEARMDLALLTGAEEIAEPEWAAREQLKPGDSVHSIAAPFGLSGSYLRGVVASTDRTGFDPEFRDIPFIQASGITFPGTSGAGVFLDDGRAAGINRSTYGAAFAGIGFIIPSGYIRAFLNAQK